MKAKLLRGLIDSIIIAGILFPEMLAIWFLSMHGGIDFFKCYAPFLKELILLIGSGLVVLALALVGQLLNWHGGKRKPAPAHNRLTVITLIIAGISIIGTTAFFAYLYIPFVVRHGDIQPQLVFSGKNIVASSSFRSIASITNPSPGLAVVFWTDKKISNKLTYGKTGQIPQNITEARPTHLHWFDLGPLESGAKYEYSINQQKIANFTAPPASGKSLRFAAGGDTHFGAYDSRIDNTIRMINLIKDPSEKYGAFFLLGDLVQLGNNDSQWKQALGTLSRLTQVVPTGYVVGNHDTIFSGEKLFARYLADPSKPQLWKRIDCGQIHFILLDLEWLKQLYTPAQQKWLITQLKSIPKNDWCIILSHTFYFCSGRHADGWDWFDNTTVIESLVPVFEQFSVDLVLSGHKHHAEVLQKNGITYVVAGSFGGVMAQPRTYVSPASIWYETTENCFADIWINGDTAFITMRNPFNQKLFEVEIQNKK
ncbi:MAG: metallophosphoesterase [Candidatus Margulisiibacteriota bacterium]